VRYNLNRTKFTPITAVKSRRRKNLTGITSMPAGKATPIRAATLLRQDQIAASTVTLMVTMEETADVLLNPVWLNFYAFFVPFLAMPKFEGSRDQYDRSYMGQPQVEGGDVVPFFDYMKRGAVGTNPVLDYMGMNGAPNDDVTTFYNQAYNIVQNWRRTNRSKSLPQRDIMDKTLAPAQWNQSRMDVLKPDWDAALNAGEVALNITERKAPVRGIGILDGGATMTTGTIGVVRTTEGNKSYARSYSSKNVGDGSGTNASDNIIVQADAVGFPDIFAELAADGITVDLANLDAARKTKAFAKMRQQYGGIRAEYLIDMMMQGLEIPDLSETMPTQIGHARVKFGMSQRYSSSSGALTESATQGMCAAQMTIGLPVTQTGGIVIFIAEALPEQLYERQADPLLYATMKDGKPNLPNYLVDELDTEKVVRVKNREVDVSHDNPNDDFAYGPLNWMWDDMSVAVGGKFQKADAADPYDSVRDRIWAMDKANPSLSQDFYEALDINLFPFIDQEADSFEVAMEGILAIRGLTVFGPALIESTGDYDAVAELVETERLEQGEV